jgi:hypothetical protein
LNKKKPGRAVTYGRARQFLDAALENPKTGILLTMESANAAKAFRMQCHMIRSNLRKSSYNLDLDDPMYGRTSYDDIQVDQVETPDGHGVRAEVYPHIPLDLKTADGEPLP